MADIGNFNANDHEEYNGEFQKIPPAWYPAIITDSIDKVQSKNKPQNYYLKCVVKIMGDNFGGRLLWENINLWNSNPEAVKIANSKFAGICKAVGVICPSDSNELLNIPFGIKVGHDKKTGDEKIVAFCSEAELSEKMSTNPTPAAPPQQQASAPSWGAPTAQQQQTQTQQAPPVSTPPTPPPFPSVSEELIEDIPY